jgi:hypothetical protein
MTRAMSYERVALPRTLLQILVVLFGEAYLRDLGPGTPSSGCSLRICFKRESVRLKSLSQTWQVTSCWLICLLRICLDIGIRSQCRLTQLKSRRHIPATIATSIWPHEGSGTAVRQAWQNIRHLPFVCRVSVCLTYSSYTGVDVHRGE